MFTMRFLLAFGAVLGALTLWCVVLHFAFKRIAFKKSPARPGDDVVWIDSWSERSVDDAYIHAVMRSANFSNPAKKGIAPKVIAPVVQMRSRERVH